MIAALILVPTLSADPRGVMPGQVLVAIHGQATSPAGANAMRAPTPRRHRAARTTAMGAATSRGYQRHGCTGPRTTAMGAQSHGGGTMTPRRHSATPTIQFSPVFIGVQIADAALQIAMRTIYRNEDALDTRHLCQFSKLILCNKMHFATACSHANSNMSSQRNFINPTHGSEVVNATRFGPASPRARLAGPKKCPKIPQNSTR
jgi:hypothetical protein